MPAQSVFEHVYKKPSPILFFFFFASRRRIQIWSWIIPIQNSLYMSGPIVLLHVSPWWAAIPPCLLVLQLLLGCQRGLFQARRDINSLQLVPGQPQGFIPVGHSWNTFVRSIQEAYFFSFFLFFLTTSSVHSPPVRSRGFSARAPPHPWRKSPSLPTNETLAISGSRINKQMDQGLHFQRNTVWPKWSSLLRTEVAIQFFFGNGSAFKILKDQN